MIDFTKKRLDDLFDRFEDRTIVVVGDVMLDKYIWGKVSRISPEAPVPVVEVESESVRFGGAANVNLNVMSLGARAIPVGVVGKDSSGDTLHHLFKEKGFPTDGLIVDPDRPTTVKTRVIANDQHVVRTDREVRIGISAAVQKCLLEVIDGSLDVADGVIIEDYDKGMLVPSFIKAVIDRATERKKAVLVDPKFDHFLDYQDVTLFKPNRKETAERLGMRLDTPEAIQEAGRKLLDQLSCGAVLITLGAEGMALFEPDKEWKTVPTQAVKVHDVSGAGDTVIATMAVAMTSGASLSEAASLANHAAGLVCGEVGIVPVERNQLYDLMKAAIE